MKVALLGAPGAGKTAIGKSLVRALNRDVNAMRWKLIDGYVDDLAKRTGRQYGAAGDIPHNLQVMTERWTREAEALHQGCSTVTSGSIYETLLYTAFTRLTPPETEQEMLQWSHEAQTTMQFFNLMEQMTFNYDVLFFIPLAGEAEPEWKDWAAVINAKLSEVLEGCFKYAVPLAHPTPRQKVTYALRIIRGIRDQLDAVAAETDDGSAVR